MPIEHWNKTFFLLSRKINSIFGVTFGMLNKTAIYHLTMILCCRKEWKIDRILFSGKKLNALDHARNKCCKKKRFYRIIRWSIIDNPLICQLWYWFALQILYQLIKSSHYCSGFIRRNIRWSFWFSTHSNDENMHIWMTIVWTCSGTLAIREMKYWNISTGTKVLVQHLRETQITIYNSMIILLATEDTKFYRFFRKFHEFYILFIMIVVSLNETGTTFDQNAGVKLKKIF